MGRDDYRRDGWGREAHYDRYRDRDRGHPYRDRRYERDDRRYDDRRGGSYRDRYDNRDRRDRYGGGGGGGGYRDRRGGGGGYRGGGGGYRGGGGGRGRGGFRGGGRDHNNHFDDPDELDPEELEYIRKRGELLKKRREEEENYVPEEVDAEALAAMGLPTGFGPPPKAEEEDGEENDRHDDRNSDDRDRRHRDDRREDRQDDRRQSEERSEEKKEKMDDDAAKSEQTTTTTTAAEQSEGVKVQEGAMDDGTNPTQEPEVKSQAEVNGDENDQSAQDDDGVKGESETQATNEQAEPEVKGHIVSNEPEPPSDIPISSSIEQAQEENTDPSKDDQDSLVPDSGEQTTAE